LGFALLSPTYQTVATALPPLVDQRRSDGSVLSAASNHGRENPQVEV
jgi:hypothetical protein